MLASAPRCPFPSRDSATSCGVCPSGPGTTLPAARSLLPAGCRGSGASPEGVGPSSCSPQQRPGPGRSQWWPELAGGPLNTRVYTHAYTHTQAAFTSQLCRHRGRPCLSDLFSPSRSRRVVLRASRPQVCRAESETGLVGLAAPGRRPGRCALVLSCLGLGPSASSQPPGGARVCAGRLAGDWAACDCGLGAGAHGGGGRAVAPARDRPAPPACPPCPWLRVRVTGPRPPAPHAFLPTVTCAYLGPSHGRALSTGSHCPASLLQSRDGDGIPWKDRAQAEPWPCPVLWPALLGRPRRGACPPRSGARGGARGRTLQRAGGGGVLAAVRAGLRPPGPRSGPAQVRRPVTVTLGRGGAEAPSTSSGAITKASPRPRSVLCRPGARPWTPCP